MKSITLGIIGGKGKMGAFFAKALRPHLKEVLISDQNGALSKEELMKRSDWILIAVPIHATEIVIREITPYTSKEQLLTDITSLKKAPCGQMLQSKASVIGMHPLFGPNVPSMAGQSIILCPARERGWKSILREILTLEGAKLLELTPERHDEMMGVMQSLVHFIAMIFTKTMQDRGIDPKEISTFSTPVFQMLFYLTGRILNQSAELYQDIQMENTFFPEILTTFESSLKQLKEIDLNKDGKAFVDLFNNLGEYLGEMKQLGHDMTTHFIRSAKEL